ncbi:protein translocase subunit SecD, partial [Planctomycetota bacterium]
MQIKAWKYAVIAATAAIFLAASVGFPLTRGIDLAGGTVLIYELQTTEPSDDLTRATADILQRRLDTLGLKEMSIRPAGVNQIMIQLPGVSGDSAARIKKVIATSGKLFFKIVAGKNGKIKEQRNDEEMKERIEEIESAKSRGQYSIEDYGYDTALYQEKVEDKIVEQYPILLMNDDMVDGKYLASARRSAALTLQQSVDFFMKPAGRSRLAHTTRKHQNKQMAIVLDGVVISAPNIRTPIPDGTGQIEGTFTKEEIDELVTVLKSGALPAKPLLQSEDTIAATLGEEAISGGMIAIQLGVLLTLIFMIVYYRAAGVIADIALILNLIILLGVMTAFEATLTLPGIAGIVLTMGMAVDANILINERIREESARGVPIAEAVSGGFGHALSAILDSNLTTIFTAGILYYVGTGPIKGFAVTLFVGIGASLFTALWVTRALFELFMAKGWYTRPNYVTFLADSKIEFLKNRGPFVRAAVVLAACGFLIFSVRGPEKYGIDFNGGSAVQIRFKPEQAMTQEEVREKLVRLEVEVDGAMTRPYENQDLEIQRLSKEKKATLYQVLLNSRGEEEQSAAAVSADQRPEAMAGSESGDVAETEAEEETDRLAAATPQERFMRHVERAFADALIAETFGKAVWSEGEVEGKSVRRMKLKVRFDTSLSREKGISAESIQAALQPEDETVKSFGRDAKVVALPESDAEETGIRGFEVTTRDLDFNESPEVVETDVKTTIEKAFGRELANPFPFKTSIGATVAKNLKARGILAIILSLIMIIVYIAFRFEFKMGIAAAICLFHDVLVSLGCMMLFDLAGFDAKINLTTIAAFLTIVGYSINDTIVTFDRMRENLARQRIDAESPEFEPLLNQSINQMLSRTILTSVTVLMVLVVLALAGVKSLEGFTLALIVGATMIMIRERM